MSDKVEIKVVDQVLKPGFEENFINDVRIQMEKLLREATKDIIKRTQSGKDADGRSFIPYTEQYRKRKASLGKSTDPVNLTLSGTMLNSLVGETRRTRGRRSDNITATIKVTDSNRGKVEGVTKLRPFLGISKELQETFLKLGDLLDIKKANR